MRSIGGWWLVLACVVAAPVLALPNHASSEPVYVLKDRFGVNVTRDFGSNIADYDVATLGIGWYTDWGYSVHPLRPGGIEFAQTVKTRPGSPPDWNAVASAIAANPGAVWFVGNEPDASPGIQDEQPPEAYAAAYHDIYTFIKERDSTARVGPGGVIEPTPLRLRYLDLVLSAYQAQYGESLPCDFWGTHVQILQEVRGDWGAGIPDGIADDSGRLYSVQDNANPAIFEQLIWELRTWMASRGLRDKPLIVSEYGVLMPSLYVCFCYDYAVGDAMVVNFMTRSFQFMLSATDPALGYPADGNRLVQRWSWYSLNDKPYDVPPYGNGYNGSLFDFRNPHFPGTLTVFGQAFKSFTFSLLAPYHQYFATIVQGR